MTRVVILFLVMLGALDAAYIEVNQNMKALYKGVKLTEAQESYILDNQDKNINILKSIIKEEVKKLDTKFVNDKNVVEFMMNENGTIDNVKFLKKSDERSLDKMTMKIVEQASKQMITPKEKTP
ncbi:energy transducer TonB, partial [bacterium]|nr:energy transducer TonB [bacterium]